MMVLMNCQKMVLMDSLQRLFFKVGKVRLALFTYVSILFSSTKVLPNCLA